MRLFTLLVFGRAQPRPNSPRMPNGCGIPTGSANPNEHVGLKKIETLERKSFALEKREGSLRGEGRREGQSDEPAAVAGGQGWLRSSAKDAGDTQQQWLSSQA